MPTYNTVKLNARALRALRAARNGITYKLGQGGFKPADKLPTRNGTCDCSGFVAWCLGMSRDMTPNGSGKGKLYGYDWIETTNIHRDATGKQKLFRLIDKPLIGSIVVYPDSTFLGVKRQGHVGIVTSLQPFRVTDCASGSSREYGEAITQNEGKAFTKRKDAVYCVLNEDLA